MFSFKIKQFFNKLETRYKNKKLIKKYPFLKAAETNDYTWMDSIPIGWHNVAFKYFDKIMMLLKAKNKVHILQLSDVKEKYGSLRINSYIHFYCTRKDDIDLHNKIEDILHELEHETWKTCIHCGKPAKYETVGWITPICEKCMEEESLEYPNIEYKKWEDWSNG